MKIILRSEVAKGMSLLTWNWDYWQRQNLSQHEYYSQVSSYQGKVNIDLSLRFLTKTIHKSAWILFSDQYIVTKGMSLLTSDWDYW